MKSLSTQLRDKKTTRDASLKNAEDGHPRERHAALSNAEFMSGEIETLQEAIDENRAEAGQIIEMIDRLRKSNHTSRHRQTVITILETAVMRLRFEIDDTP